MPVPAALALNARATSVSLSLYAGHIDPARRYARGWRILESLGNGRWNDFVVSVRWSRTDGAVQVWHRVGGPGPFRRVFAIDGVPTLQVDDAGASPNYLKLGLYRDHDTRTAVLFHDAMRRGSSLAQVIEAGPDPVRGKALQRLVREDQRLVSTHAERPSAE